MILGSRVRGFLVAALLLVSACAAPSHRPAPAQAIDHLPSIAGDYFPIQSREAGHLYHVFIRLPQGYSEQPGKRYPVVYLLDGDGLFPVIGGNHVFLTIDDKLPEAIIVGVAYGSFAMPTDRRHIDFMPPGSAEPSGTAAFHRFLERELLPQVESRVRADPARRILFGQSRGGAMVLYSAFTQPDLFWARIASNPSWTPGREIFFGQPAIAARNDLHLFVALGTEERTDRLGAADAWFRHWRGRATPWSLERIDIQGGTHSADAGNAYRAAMRRLFAAAR
jgi:uncharacterized protein